MMTSNLEIEFIEKMHMTLSNSMDYWIGGATTHIGTIELSQYMKHPPCEG